MPLIRVIIALTALLGAPAALAGGEDTALPEWQPPCNWMGISRNEFSEQLNSIYARAQQAYKNTGCVEMNIGCTTCQIGDHPVNGERALSCSYMGDCTYCKELKAKHPYAYNNDICLENNDDFLCLRSAEPGSDQPVDIWQMAMELLWKWKKVGETCSPMQTARKFIGCTSKESDWSKEYPCLTNLMNPMY